MRVLKRRDRCHRCCSIAEGREEEREAGVESGSLGEGGSEEGGVSSCEGGVSTFGSGEGCDERTSGS